MESLITVDDTDIHPLLRDTHPCDCLFVPGIGFDVLFLLTASSCIFLFGRLPTSYQRRLNPQASALGVLTFPGSP